MLSPVKGDCSLLWRLSCASHTGHKILGDGKWVRNIDLFQSTAQSYILGQLKLKLQRRWTYSRSTIDAEILREYEFELLLRACKICLSAEQICYGESSGCKQEWIV